MTKTSIPKLSVTDAISKYGQCLELVSMDKHFHDISIGLYARENVCTLWTFSQKLGVSERIERIRDQLVTLGGMTPVDGTLNQTRFSCGCLHRKVLKFLLKQAVTKAPDYRHPEGEIAIKDTKSQLNLKVIPLQINEQRIYRVSAEGEDDESKRRLPAVILGFVRYGGMEKIGEREVSFSCGQSHDELARILLPHARNISAVQEMMETDALRGQMTTSTLGFNTQ